MSDGPCLGLRVVALLVGTELVRVMFPVYGHLLGWLWAWFGSLSVSCFRLGVVSLFVSMILGVYLF